MEEVLFAMLSATMSSGAILSRKPIAYRDKAVKVKPEPVEESLAL